MQIITITAAFLVLLFIIGKVYDKRWSDHFEAALRFNVAGAFEGEKVKLVETVTNRKWLPLPWVHIKFMISTNIGFAGDKDDEAKPNAGLQSDNYYRDDLFSVIMFQRIVRTHECVCKKRGYYFINRIDVVSSNIFASKKYVRKLESNAAIAVYPKRAPIYDFPDIYRRISGSVIARRHIYPDPFEFRGIREYERTDPLKTVNFKAAAKTGALMTNVYNNTVSQEVAIILNLQKYLAWSSESVMERAISMAAAIAEDMIADGVPVSFVTNGRDVITNENIEIQSGSGGGHLTAIYESMARISYAERLTPLSARLGEIISAADKEPVYIIISTYCESDLREKFNEMTGLGFEAYWFIPVLAPDAAILKVDEFTTDVIIKCEVSEYDGRV